MKFLQILDRLRKNLSPTVSPQGLLKSPEIPERAWLPEELELIDTTYSQRFPEEYRAYLEWENDRGFLSEEMMCHLEDHHIATLFPGLHSLNYTHAAIDFRFMQDRRRHFVMWQPERQADRQNGYHIFLTDRAGLGFRRARRRIRWSDEDKIRFTRHMQSSRPELWAEYISQLRDIGFCGGWVWRELMAEYRNFFAFPEDLNGDPYWGYDLTEVGLVKVDQLGTEKETWDRGPQLNLSWLKAKKKRVSFEDWLEQTRALIKEHPGDWSIHYKWSDEE